ncbi:MAG TPA: SagB/ThcOx family dehydrogenase [bacterium]|nr:SagB/ThcOx family dehydrogenase [bacterium]
MKKADTYIETIKLPDPLTTGKMSVEQALYQRRSIRNFKNISLTLQELSQILWAAQGITDKTLNFRTAPSAGATYPLDLFVAVGNVDSIKQGLYKYNPSNHTLTLIMFGDKRIELANAALGQKAITTAAVNIIFTAIVERTEKRYKERALQYVYIETGHAAQNVYIQAEALNLATVAIGAFYEDKIKKVINTAALPVYIMSIGKK